jgi:murein DD-endopeptidase MepM/ murein hydrolase activator NlpD
VALAAGAVIATGADTAGAHPSGSTRTGGSGSGSSTGRWTDVVRPGDTVAAIARRNGVEPADVRAANGVADDRLYAGARLVIDPAASTGGRANAPTGPRILCPVRGASFVNDWGFPRGGGTRGHQGTDLFAPRGTPVGAPITGTITFATDRLGGRTFTIVSPSGWVAYGAHLASTVGGSRWVAAGQLVGTVGDSGNARGGAPHLHLQLRRGAAPPVNPYPSVDAAC